MSLTNELQDLKEQLAVVLETAARELRNGDSPHRIAHHLEACGKLLRDSHARVAEHTVRNDD